MSQNLLIQAKVRTKSPEFRLEKREEWRIYCQSPPKNNKANLEIIRELERLTNRRVKIIKGLTSKKKSILIYNVTEEEFEEMIT